MAKSALARALFEQVLAGETPEADAVVRLAREEWEESLFHDFKRGLVLDDLKGRARLVWEVASFANADGQKGPRKVSPLPLGNGRGYAARIDDLLRPLAPMLRPAPRHAEVEIEGGVVVLLAVPRAEQLVAAKEPKTEELGYPLRFGDGTHRCPEYLVSDLRLGRRERPEVELRIEKASLKLRSDRPSTLELDVLLTNSGLTWIDDTMLFLVAPVGSAVEYPPRTARLRSSLPASLGKLNSTTTDSSRRLLESVETAGEPCRPASVARKATDAARIPLAPFQSERFRFQQPLALRDPLVAPPDGGVSTTHGVPGGPTEESARGATWRFALEAAICAVPRGATPQWFQLTATILNTGEVDACAVERAADRPRVAFTELRL